MAMDSHKVAVVDIGSNSTRLLIADVDRGRVSEVERQSRVTRLGRGVDLSGQLSAEAIEAACEAIADYVAICREGGIETVEAIATSAVRDASNGSAFVAELRERFALSARVLDGEEEARLTYLGATSEHSPTEPTLVVDIGGGSTELILGTGDGAVEGAHSLDIGSVRLNERHLHTDPPIKDEIREAVEDIDATLDTSTVDLGRAASVIGVAGTVTTIAAGVLGLEHYEPELIHRSVLRPDAVQGQVTQLLSMMVEQRKALGYMHPGRADVIGAGGLILDRVLRRTTVGSLLVSEHDILDGIAWSMVGR